MVHNVLFKLKEQSEDTILYDCIIDEAYVSVTNN